LLSAPVTIGLPVRNCEATLRLALASLLAQTYADWELLIVDDGSSDKTATIAAEAADDERIQFLADGRSLGLPARLNQMIAMARGSLFVRMDADDIAYPHRLQRQVDFLADHPEVDVVGSSVLVFHTPENPFGKRLAPSTHSEICRRPTAGFPLFHPTWAGTTAWFRKYRYDEGISRGEEQDLLHRAYRESTFANIPEILLGYRVNLRLRLILSGRANFARRVARRRWKEGAIGSAATVVGEQLVKGAVDTLAAPLGTRHSVVPRRASRLSSAEHAQWERVWHETRTWAGEVVE
jgi:glycosyltransferase involved in cell wall biosynthesis